MKIGMQGSPRPCRDGSGRREVLADNVPMLKVFERSGLAMSERYEGPVVHVTLRYSPSPS